MSSSQQALLGVQMVAAGGNGYYRTITVDHTKVPNTDQTNFPIVITGTYSYLATVANGGKVNNGSGWDVGFYSDAALTTKLKWEIVGWNGTTGKVEYHVKIATLSHSTDNVIYMGYGQTSISTDQSDRTNVWDTNFRCVVHGGDGTTLVVGDKSSYSVTGTNSSTTAATGAFAGGTLGGSINFNGTNQSISYGNNFGLTSDITYSIWGYSTNWSCMWQKDSSGSGVANPVATNFSGAFNQGRFIVGNGTLDSGHTIRTTSTPPSNTWTKYDFIISGLNYTIMKNGSTETTGTYATLTRTDSASYNSLFGHNNAGTEWYSGKLDEVRISDIARSTDWCTTEYNNQSSPSTFYTLGSEVAL